MSAALNPHGAKCPLSAVDRRLDDVHRQWHEAEKAYFDPDGFRVAIQTAIQTLRTVTFILQRNKRIIPNFDPWYQEWRDRLGTDPLMRWMVEARNRIEKEGDLETHSYVRAEIVASYLNVGPVIEVPANLFDAPAALIRSIPQSDVGEHIRKHGILRIQRRWVENTLPDHELLDAVAIGYGRIAELVCDAHRQLGLAPPLTKHTETGETYPVGRGGRLPCMIGHGDTRTLDISLADGQHLDFTGESATLDANTGKNLQKRYGLKPEDIFDRSGDNKRILESLFNTAKVMTEKDGGHITIFFLFKSDDLVQIIQFQPETQSKKYLFMRKLAHEVTILDADAIIMIGEVWRAQADAAKPYMRPADAPDREELLAATLVRKEGMPVQMVAKMTRRGKRVSLGKTEVNEDGAHFMFSPIYEAWGKPIPGAWLELENKNK